MSEQEYRLSFVPGELLLVIDHPFLGGSGLISYLESKEKLEPLREFFTRIRQDTFERFGEPLQDEANITEKNYSQGEANDESSKRDTKVANINTVSSGNGSNTSYWRFELTDERLKSDAKIIAGQVVVMEIMMNHLSTIREIFDKEKLDIVLTSICPNWLSAGSQSLKTDGGPGSKATPITSKTTKIKPVIKKNTQNNVVTTDNVQVFVLDTIPFYCKKYGQEAIDCFLTEKRADHGQSAKRIVDYYTELDKQLNIIPDPIASEYNNIDTAKHPGTMTDHGLFIAGLIHDIVPYQEINLIQVLNDNGVGTLFSLASGVQQVLNLISPKNRRVVVNMSLTFAIPRINSVGVMPNLGDIKANWRLYKLYSEFLKFTLCNKDAISGLVELIRKLERVTNTEANNVAFVVAAAGNDGTSGVPRPKALYPAAFDDVIGVGALKASKQEYADFSNHADNPNIDGLSIRGEDLIGPFLNSNTGFAKWNGTSFASGVVAGTIADLLARYDIDDILERINDSSNMSASSDGSKFIEVEEVPV